MNFCSVGIKCRLSFLPGPELKTERNNVEDAATDNERSFLFGPRSSRATNQMTPSPFLLQLAPFLFLGWLTFHDDSLWQFI